MFYLFPRSSTPKECQQHHYYPGPLQSKKASQQQLTVLAWLGKLHECITSIYVSTCNCHMCSTCIYRLGEACSHIAALLSCVVKAAEARQTCGRDSCTSQKCMWLPPAKNVRQLCQYTVMYNLFYAFILKVTPARVCDIQFVCPRNKKRCVEGDDQQKQACKEIAPPSPAAVSTFIQEINMAEKKPAILKIIQPYAQDFIPKSCSPALPLPMMELYNPEALHMGYLTLLEECESTFQSIKVR